MRSRGILTIVSGFSGAGKGTIVTRLVEQYEDYALSISATTRKPREGEVEGVSYFYKTKEEFQRMIDNDELLEYAQYVDNFYGTPRKFVEEQLDDGMNVILEIDVQGALQIKEKYPEALLVFVTAPSIEILKERLNKRGTETEEQIRSRLLRAAEELPFIDQYDFLLVSRDPEYGTHLLNEMIKAEHCRPSRRQEYINSLREQLEQERGK